MVLVSSVDYFIFKLYLDVVYHGRVYFVWMFAMFTDACHLLYLFHLPAKPKIRTNLTAKLKSPRLAIRKLNLDHPDIPSIPDQTEPATQVTEEQAPVVEMVENIPLKTPDRKKCDTTLNRTKSDSTTPNRKHVPAPHNHTENNMIVDGVTELPTIPDLPKQVPESPPAVSLYITSLRVRGIN